MHPLYLVSFFFLTAFFYASVGFGGGSTYLALLTLFSFSFQSTPQIALLCNIAVVTESFLIFSKAGHFSVKKAMPFAITSVPAAYLGGLTPISENLFLSLLAAALFASGLRLLFSPQRFVKKKGILTQNIWKLGLPAGAVLGLLSGLVGIGGGIFLAPLLYFVGWGDSKEIAACCSFFILVNSASGFIGQWTKNGLNVETWQLMLPLLLAVLAGGFLGARLGAGHMPKSGVQKVSALLILFVSLRLLWKLA